MLGARAHGGASEASAASSLSLALPVAASLTAPVMILSAGAVLTVTAVEASAHSTAWVLERASDGASAVVEFSAGTIAASVVAAGTVVSVTALAAGWLLGGRRGAVPDPQRTRRIAALRREDHAMKAALLPPPCAHGGAARPRRPGLRGPQARRRELRQSLNSPLPRHWRSSAAAPGW